MNASLTPAQKRIAARLVLGESNKDIARRLCLSEATVKAQLHLMYARTETANRTQLAISYARVAGCAP